MRQESLWHSNPARRHHFIPRFYLRAWCGEQRQLWVYGRNRVGKLFLKRRPDKAVGYVEDLYALRPEGVHPALDYAPDAIERDFFSRLDNDAAVVYANLVANGPTVLSKEERQTWALFLNSLLERNPRRLDELRKVLPETIEESKQQWPSSRLGADLESMDWNAVAHNNMLSALVAYIENPEFIEHISAMEWRVLCLRQDSEDHFLTSDSPLVVNGGLSGAPVKLLSIALTPKHLLVIHPAVPEFDFEFLGKLAMMHGFQVTKQAGKHVFSSREIRNGKYVKYLKGAEELFANRDGQTKSPT
ncbi:DUF4238 domain-containing protein [Desulfovibrionaceae bacterium CB1MN]|uniref:DUF4238 domain-containing protein n=1 Tax=Hydrosulfovibrio ferrireducens TaxID=2934181 RepID=UPI003ABAE409